MNPNHVVHRDGKQAKWVIVTQILLIGERQFFQIINRLNVVRRNASRLHPQPVRLNGMIDAFNGIMQAFTL